MAFNAGALKLTTTSKRLEMGDRLDGQASFTAKKAVRGCRIRVQLDFEVRVKIPKVGEEGGYRSKWYALASSRVELPDDEFDLQAHKARVFPFSLEARVPDTRPRDHN